MSLHLIKDITEADFGCEEHTDGPHAVLVFEDGARHEVSEKWISDSPYIHAFDGLDEIHHQKESDVLNEKMNSIGFKLILQDMTELPNSKALVRQDYKKMI